MVATIIILIALGLAVFFALRATIRRFKNSLSGKCDCCSGSCAGCKGCEKGK
jgi:hypothetical protein